MTIDDEKLRLWLDAAVESAFRAGAAEERAAVVAWLEELSASSMNHDPVEELLYAARSIERGEHRREEER